MKRFILSACAGLIAATVASPSFAADLLRPTYQAPPYKAPNYSPDYSVAPFSWTGFYIGINGGYGFGKSEWSSGPFSSGDFDLSGGLVGGTLGYNLQTGVWVWGLEGDFDASWIKGSTTVAGCYGCETQNVWLATARGRIGYAWDRWLPYITGGAAFGSIKMTPPAPDTYTSKTKFGWTVGAGVEYAFLDAWSAKLEYLYVDLGKASCGSASCVGGVDVKFNTSIVRAGVNYRF
jgi:outer membrane immunogenic protein